MSPTRCPICDNGWKDAHVCPHVNRRPSALVREFHEHFSYPIAHEPKVPTDGLKGLRRRLLAEEAREADEAVESDDLVAIAGELADVVYVAYGTALTYGIDLDRVIAEVHRANMTKDRGEGESGKAVKGERFTPANLRAALYGWHRHKAWQDDESGDMTCVICGEVA